MSPTGFQELESHHLVPGDTLVLKEGKTLLPCDAILISGQCIVNESMLTGTAHPSQVYHQNIIIALWLQPVTQDIQCYNVSPFL